VHTASGGPGLRVGSVRIDPIDLDDAVDLILDPARPVGVHLCNAYTVASAERDPVLARDLAGADVMLADGTPLVWLARLRGIEGPRARVYGPDVMLRSLDRGRRRGTRHFLLGTDRGTLAQLESALASRFPGVIIAGRLAPPFSEPGEADLAAWADTIAATEADVVWVALGTPRQDRVVRAMSRAVPSRTYVAIGAAFDFLAGTKRQAPAWIGRIGMEWAFRLACEPRRLWRRYLIGNALFLVAAARGSVDPVAAAA
jgi:N-acetylglucosaminyldiphosphoundecaprenol N-acetyl-beta-D-mannosaminyltransferase